MENKQGPKVLILDIETAPITAYIWKLFDENTGLDQIQHDWHIIAACAKWLDKKELFYMDQRNQKDISNDKKILEMMWHLMDEADIVVTQNGVNFDIKKLNARFVLNGMKPPSSFKNIDTKILAKNNFSFTSNKLEYMSEKLCTKYKKLDHKKFPGFKLWVECLKGNLTAWKEMERYNKHDVLSLEELYKKLIPWDSKINFGVYYDTSFNFVCSCGGTSFIKHGFHYTTCGKFQRWDCKNCGRRYHDKNNLFSRTKMDSLKRGN